MSQQFDIGSATGPTGSTAVTFANESAGATNLSVSPTTLKVANTHGDYVCDQSGPTESDPLAPNDTPPDNRELSFGVSAPAGCGSVVLQGTFTSVTLNVSTNLQKMAAVNGWLNGLNWADTNILNATDPQLVDLARVSLRLQEDMGDAPASYDAGQAAAHIIGPLQLGSTITADADDTANPVTSPNSGPADRDTDEAINDGVNSWTAMQGEPYSITVPLVGADQAGTVAGWIDANQNGVFDSGERVSATFAAGASSVTLTWPEVTLPDPSAPTYMRLRTAFDAGDVASPTGVARSGEVEDYLLPVGAISVVKSINGDDANLPPGVTVADGSTMSITYVVTNDGAVDLDSVVLTDLVNAPAGAAAIVIVPPIGWTGTLAAGDTVTFTATYPAPAPGVQHTDTGTVVGTPVGQDPSGTPGTVTDDDPANANVLVPTATPTPTPPASTPPATTPPASTPPATTPPDGGVGGDSGHNGDGPSSDTGEDELASTGGPVAALGGVGFLVVALGLGLVIAGRRRSTE